MAPSGVRSPDDTPQPPGAGPGPATLAGAGPGGGGDDATPPAGGAPDGGMGAKLGQAVQVIMKTELTVTDLARQFPAAAPSLRQAVDGLRQAGAGLRTALKQVMTNPGQPEPPAPNIGG